MPPRAARARQARALEVYVLRHGDPWARWWSYLHRREIEARAVLIAERVPGAVVRLVGGASFVGPVRIAPGVPTARWGRCVCCDAPMAPHRGGQCDVCNAALPRALALAGAVR